MWRLCFVAAISNELLPLHKQLLILNFSRLCVVIEDPIDWQIWFFVALFNQLLNHIVICHIVFPLVKPPPVYQVKLVIKLVPVGLVQQKEKLGYMLAFLYFILDCPRCWRLCTCHIWCVRNIRTLNYSKLLVCFTTFTFLLKILGFFRTRFLFDSRVEAATRCLANMSGVATSERSLRLSLFQNGPDVVLVLFQLNLVVLVVGWAIVWLLSLF